MELILDPSNWAALLTLIVLEVTLGIDNLLFITIISNKLPVYQRDKARIIGLSLALCIRLILLSLVSWITTLNNTVLQIKSLQFSSKDIILLLGGLFLLFKAITELNDRLDHSKNIKIENKTYTSFWFVIFQIILLDVIFSLDSIITSVGVVNKLSMMIISMIIAMIIMLFAAKVITKFINDHPTIVLLCISFLLMIGLSLIAEATGFFIPKGYLYTAVVFSTLIELFNQIARRNFIRYQSSLPMRKRLAEIVIKLMTKKSKKHINTNEIDKKKYYIENYKLENEEFKDEERYMMRGVLTLAGRSIRSIMTPRGEISWVNSENENKKIRRQLLKSPHSLFPVCKGELDEIIGIVRAKELLIALEKKIDILHFSAKTPPIIIPDTLDTINLLKILRKSKGNFVMVTNEFGAVQGLITPLDVLEAIAGEFPDADETPDVIEEKNSWLVKGNTDLHSLEQLLNVNKLVDKEEKCASLAGLLISKIGSIPNTGKTIKINNLKFTILKSTEYQIKLVRIKKIS
ncbi:TerC family protein [Buchnera aphidicola (Ceratoglyphina bambusae)]|uniref:TerC family protein n=1 Tax=Buchnera aphidicola TaxID=9 RepID=UPI0031B8844E